MMRPNLLHLYRVLIWARYLRFLLDSVQYYAYLQLDPARIVPDTPIPPSSDFTVISVTLGAQRDYPTSVQSWLAGDPAAVVIVTIDEALPQLQALINPITDPRIHLYSVDSVPGMNWRPAACEGVRRTETPYLVFVDDDVIWGSRTLEHIACAFANPEVGGVNTMQEVYPNGPRFTTWETFGALNLVRRNILHSFLAYFRDGDVLNLSGRTAAYRTNVLQLEEFYFALKNDYWRDRHLIVTGDDNFLTSWVVRQGWKTRFLNRREAVVATSMNDDASYLNQLMRWSRDTARSYLRDFGFAIRTRSMSFLIYCISKTTANYISDMAVVAEIGVLLVFTASLRRKSKTRSLSHQQLPALKKLWRDHVMAVGIFQIFEHAPFFATLQNLIFIPGAIIYAYIHAAVVLRAILTLNKSVWDSRL